MKRSYCILLSLVLLLLSCSRDEGVGAEEQVPEGEPVRICVRVDEGVLARSGLGPSREKGIHNVFVMVFDKTGTKVSQSYFTSGITSSLANVPTVSGSDMSVYIVANLSQQNTNSGFVSDYFNNIHTVAQLNQAMLYNLAEDLNVNRDLVMYGSVTGLTISPVGTQNVPVTLKYVVAKVTLYVVTDLSNNLDSYNLTNWTVVNYPQKSYLFPQSTDAVNPSVSSDYSSSVTSIAWVDTMLVINGTSTPAKYAFLYMYENRRGTNSNTTETQKATNVPAKATAMVLQGYYKVNSANAVTGVTTTIYLGDNNYNDYNVNRGSAYSYIVTVKGISQINVDSRVSSNMYGYQVNLFSTTLDCHPDWRPLQINSWPGTATINLYESDGVTPCSWLRVSTINLNQAVNNARPTYNPDTDMVNTLTLTYPVTSPQTIASRMVYLYAAENLSTTSRSAVVKVTSFEDLVNSQTITIPVTQLGYYTMGNVGFRAYNPDGSLNNGDDYIIAIESNEEIAMTLTPGAAAGTEGLINAQWGFNTVLAEPTSLPANYYYRNGFQNTLKLVYNNFTGSITSTLIPPYGRSSAASSTSPSVTISEDAMNPIFNTYPGRYCFEKNRDLDGDGKISNPNTKNVNEIFWYLPSAEELYLMGVGRFANTDKLTSGSNYSASTEIYGISTQAQSYVADVSVSGPINKSSYQRIRCVRKIYPSSQTTQNSPYIEAGTRVMNNAGFKSGALRATNVSCPIPLHTYPNAINQQISKRFVVAASDVQLYGNTGVTNMTWAEAYGLTTASNNSSSSFVIASPATGCNAYSESGYPAGTWRLPTQRELYLMFIMRNELAAQPGNGFTGFKPSAWYYTATNTGATSALLGLHSTYFYISFSSKSSNTVARCVRDL